MTVAGQKQTSTTPVTPSTPGPAAGRTGKRWILPALIWTAWIVLVGAMGGLSSKTTEVQKNDNSAFLPKTAEATVVLEQNKRFVDKEVMPTLLIYGRDTGLTDADK